VRDEDLAGVPAARLLDVVTAVTMILALPPAAADRVDALVVAIGQGEERRLTQAIRRWERNPRLRHLLVANGNPAEQTYREITLDYLRGGARRTIGHDPLGVWMVWLLWALVLLLAVTGWMSRLDAFWGDDRVHAVHAVLADILIVAVALHLAGVAVMSWRWRENLPAAMLSGRKRPQAEARAERGRK